MSYINIHKVDTEEDDRQRRVPNIGDHTEEASLGDGEEISAVIRILQLLDTLENHEAIVITVNNF